MSLPVILGIAVGLAFDAMSVAVAASLMLGRVTWRQVFRFGFHFGLFQGLMPIIGWYAGRGVEKYIHAWDHWAAFMLLMFIGGKAIVDAIRREDSEQEISDPTRGWSLVLLSLATSIDALGVGLNFGLLDVEIWTPSLTIALTTSILTVLGMLLSKHISSNTRRTLQIAGGIILILIGAKILLEHLLAQP